jgi:non-heme chloroperoxidase
MVIFDYLRVYGDADLGGVHFVDAITKLGTDAAIAVLSPKFNALGAGLFSNNVEESVATLQAFVQLLTRAELPLTDFYLLLGFNTIVPPHVRQESYSRTLENDDVLSALRVPVLITHGSKDDVVLFTLPSSTNP